MTKPLIWGITTLYITFGAAGYLSYGKETRWVFFGRAGDPAPISGNFSWVRIRICFLSIYFPNIIVKKYVTIFAVDENNRFDPDPWTRYFEGIDLVHVRYPDWIRKQINQIPDIEFYIQHWSRSWGFSQAKSGCVIFIGIGYSLNVISDIFIRNFPIELLFSIRLLYSNSIAQPTHKDKLNLAVGSTYLYFYWFTYLGILSLWTFPTKRDSTLPYLSNVAFASGNQLFD